MAEESKKLDTSSSESGPNEGLEDTSDEGIVNAPEPAFGWTSYAELINGRFAMIGFLSLIILELLTHKSFFQWLFK